MIDLNNILEWKQNYGDIYQMQIQEQHFIFRPIGREEYKEIIFLDLDLGEFQEAICFQSVIYPEEYDFSKGIAGISEVLSDSILDTSGLHIGQAKLLLDDFRVEMSNFDYQADCMIHEAFPEFSLEDISTWSVRKTMFYLSRSEWILTSLKGVKLDMLDEEEMQKLLMQQQQMEAQQQQPPQQPAPPIPYQREIREELVGFKEPPKKQTHSTAPEGAIQSEEELLAMLAGAGGKISNPSTDMKDIKPELNWFQHMDELKGDFD
jgi:hypothetical protein